MSELNITALKQVTLDSSKDGNALPVKSDKQATETETQKRSKLLDKPSAQIEQSTLNLNYSVSKEDNALHLKVMSANGELIREVHFDRFDPSLHNTSKLKGVFIDDNS